ncbi:MAG: 50S ribosomal protein L30 [Clostridia bacterium]|nr:50S ribosomal protein L30 [Clostridia bacterium]
MKIKITLVKSPANRIKNQKANLTALGLGKTNSSVIKEDRKEIQGMIAKVAHLVKVEQVAE